MNSINRALTAAREAQGAVLIHLQTFLRSGGADAAQRLDDAIVEERRILEQVCGERREYLPKKPKVVP